MSGRVGVEQTPDIEAVLRAHDWKWKAATPQRLVIVCACGDELVQVTSSAVATLDDHRAHVADRLAAAVRETRAAELREAADFLEGRLGVRGTLHNLWDFREWLRLRADSLADGIDADAPEHLLWCCNVREPDGVPCDGFMEQHGPEYVCRSCRARCGSLSHPQHASAVDAPKGGEGR